MTDITVTAAQIAVLYPTKADVRSYIAAEAITKGNAVYFTTAGKAGIADANAAGKQQFRGIALNTAPAGGAVDVIHKGEVAGFAVSGINADALVYLSDNVGKIADGVGTMTVPVGRVVVLTNGPTATKVLLVAVSWTAQWS